MEVLSADETTEYHVNDGLVHILSNSLSLPFIACSFGFPALWSHASILLHWTSCIVLGILTATVKRVAAPGALLVNPQRLNSAIASTAASYNVVAVTSTLCLMPSLSVKETMQVRAVGTGIL